VCVRVCESEIKSNRNMIWRRVGVGVFGVLWCFPRSYVLSVVYMCVYIL